MYAVAETPRASRSQFHSRLREWSRPRGRYQKTENGEIKASIRTLTNDRAICGYRRIWVPLDRQRESAGHCRLNRKCNYRLMSQSGRLRWSAAPASRMKARTTVRSSPSARTSDECLTASRLSGATDRAFELPSHSTSVIAT